MTVFLFVFQTAVYKNSNICYILSGNLFYNGLYFYFDAVEMFSGNYRRTFIRTIIDKCAAWNFKPDAAGLFYYGAATVSYTHLDVYKRQESRTTATM